MKKSELKKIIKEELLKEGYWVANATAGIKAINRNAELIISILKFAEKNEVDNKKMIDKLKSYATEIAQISREIKQGKLK